MAIYNESTFDYRNKCKEKYQELLLKISSLDENKNVNEFYLAYEHIKMMEDINHKLEVELDKYKNCFSLINSCLQKNN